MRVLLFSLALFFLAVVLLKAERKKTKDFPKLLSLEQFNPLQSILCALKLFAKIFFSLLVLGIVLALLGFLDTYKIAEVITQQDSLALFVAVSVGPASEEIFFRGYLQKKIGVVISSLLFAVLHYGYGSVTEILGALIVSIILGLELRKSNDLHACILAHAAYNLFSITMVLHFL